MHPNIYLKTFWQMRLRPQVFVAMSFADAYKSRFDNVIAPAIRSVDVNNVSLEPFRVDFSKSGDSILTDIMDGIAHCQMFIADVSVIGYDSKTGIPYSNGNVMYEVGLALACRQTTEVLLIRDDREKFLFDVSTVPHVHLNFSNVLEARQELHDQILQRMRERNLILDARVQQAVGSLTNDEITLIERFAGHRPPATWGFKSDGSVNFLAMSALPRLCEMQIIRLVHKWDGGGGAYQWTELGWVVAQLVNHAIPSVKGTDIPPPANNPS